MSYTRLSVFAAIIAATLAAAIELSCHALVTDNKKPIPGGGRFFLSFYRAK